MLRKRLLEMNMTQREFAVRVGRCEKWVCDLMYGRAVLTLRDIWRIIDILELDPGDFAVYFPKK